MITCHLMGGLGNQLFEIYTTLSYAIQSNQSFAFLNVKQLGDRFTYWDSFFKRLRPCLISSIPHFKVIREVDFTYRELPILHDCVLHGYFQSYKYFQDKREEIHKYIGIDHLKSEFLNKLGLSLDASVSMHFRLGDYKLYPQCHPILSYEYYKKALQVFEGKYTIYYFCEQEDTDYVERMIYTLRGDFPELTFVSAGFDWSDWEQLLWMSCCRHNIIANSSFSWWGAYLNEHTDKIVCYPSVWFGPAMIKDLKDLFPPKWLKIECKS